MAANLRWSGRGTEPRRRAEHMNLAISEMAADLLVVDVEVDVEQVPRDHHGAELHGPRNVALHLGVFRWHRRRRRGGRRHPVPPAIRQQRQRPELASSASSAEEGRRRLRCRTAGTRRRDSGGVARRVGRRRRARAACAGVGGSHALHLLLLVRSRSLSSRGWFGSPRRLK
jgi:hypothetical protein